jgi:hypothetical protein
MLKDAQRRSSAGKWERCAFPFFFQINADAIKTKQTIELDFNRKKGVKEQIGRCSPN